MNAPEYYERSLPHRLAWGRTLFLPFQLAGSLPLEVLAQLKAELGTGAHIHCRYAQVARHRWRCHCLSPQ